MKIIKIGLIGIALGAFLATGCSSQTPAPVTTDTSATATQAKDTTYSTKTGTKSTKKDTTK